MINYISKHAFDMLQKILDVSVEEHKYNRYIKDEKIRICDIWDVIDLLENTVIIDWRDAPEDIIEGISSIVEDIQFPDNVNFNSLKEIISEYNRSGERKIILFGNSWNESDSVMLLSLTNDQINEIFGNNELCKILSKV